MDTGPSHPLVALARRYFLTYYALADAREATLMDMLIVTRAALHRGMECPREGLLPQTRTKIERVTDETERTFTELRELVRQSDAFRGLPPAHRARIERDAFSVAGPPPG